MAHRYLLVVLTAIAVLCAGTLDASAQVFATDQYMGYIVSYDDTVGTIVNPDTLFPEIEGMSLDDRGRLLLASRNYLADVIRFDPVTGLVEFLDPHVSGSDATDVYPDQGDGIYVLKQSNWKGRGDRLYESWIGYLPEGVGPADTVYVFQNQEGLLDIQVWPSGERAGNVLVLMDYDGPELIELQPTPGGTLEYLGQIGGGGLMPTDATGFAITPNGYIIIVGYNTGMHYIDEEYGYVWGFGYSSGPGYSDIEIDANGIIYLANTYYGWIERYDADGYSVGSVLDDGISMLGAIGVAGFTPTPEGEDVLVEPGDNIEVTYEEVNSSGFTTAIRTTTTDRISPESNPLPDHAQLPGTTRADNFDYIFLATDAVYSGLIQVDVIEEGSRLFFASGNGDTFRDFTVVGSIEDARGTIPRFTELPAPGSGKRVEEGPTEVVLVEDDRTLSEVSKYKFWRLELAMDVPDNMPGGNPCPWEFIEWLQKYPENARVYYDAGQYAMALSELGVMNGMIRSHAGWCIPDSSDDPLGNMVAHILAHSKTLMFSINLESGSLETGVGEALTSISLSIASPARGECVMSLSGPVGTEVAARIYSVSGQLVATVFEGTLPEGGERVVWNGLDDTGNNAASGVYFARVESENEMHAAKLVYMK